MVLTSLGFGPKCLLGKVSRSPNLSLAWNKLLYFSLEISTLLELNLLNEIAIEEDFDKREFFSNLSIILS